MKYLKINTLNPVYAQIDRQEIPIISGCLEFQAAYYIQGRFSKQRKEYTKRLIDRNGKFFTGYIPRIRGFLAKKGIQIDVEDKTAKSIEGILCHGVPDSVGKFIPRDDQRYLVSQAIKHRRGQLVAPTGTGKTVVLMMLMKAFANSKILFLCHTKGLLTQTAEKIEKHLTDDFTLFGGGHTPDKNKRIWLATVQTYVKHCMEHRKYHDIVLVDESHHVSQLDKGQYYTVLTNCFAPIRFGVTATPKLYNDAYQVSGAFAVEGLLGPIIGRVSLDAGQKEGLIVKPKIKLIQLTKNMSIKKLSKYADVVQNGIVVNNERNGKIVEETLKFVKKGKSVLIIVNKIEHGHILERALSRYLKKVSLVYGFTSDEVREETKKALQKKKVLCVICSVIWKEGINIPSLDTIILAAGGKRVLQEIGRGMRTYENKKEVVVVDFFDPSHKFLIEHFGERFCIYMNNNWV